jgi:hypothetical protein
MDVRSFKNSDIDRLNEEQMNTDDEPTMDCARCGRRGLGEEQVCIREWEGDSDAPMCAPCWDTTEEEEDLQFAMENGAELLGEDPIVYEDPDKVSAEIVEEEGHPADNTPHNYCCECDCCVACGCCECVEGDTELLVCSYCGKDENECEKNKQGEKNPITNWCGGWGMSCDDCYYRWNADTEDEEDEEDEEDPAEEIKAKIKHLLGDLDRVEGRGGVQRFLTEELRYLF